MSVQDLILNFILGVMASYLASEIRQHLTYVRHTLKRFLDLAKALYCQVISTVSSTFKWRFTSARIKLNGNPRPRYLYASHIAFFITLSFLATMISPFKVGKEIDDVDNIAMYKFKQQMSKPPFNLDEWTIESIIKHEQAHLLNKASSPPA